jgi:hypothetical protein
VVKSCRDSTIKNKNGLALGYERMLVRFWNMKIKVLFGSTFFMGIPFEVKVKSKPRPV